LAAYTVHVMQLFAKSLSFRVLPDLTALSLELGDSSAYCAVYLVTKEYLRSSEKEQIRVQRIFPYE
jgi:hypothetical protein